MRCHVDGNVDDENDGQLFTGQRGSRGKEKIQKTQCILIVCVRATLGALPPVFSFVSPFLFHSWMLLQLSG